MLRIRAVTAGLALAVGLGTSSAALAPAANASAARPATVATRAATAAAGSYRTWHRAQRAAGFALRRPTRRHGLKRSGDIIVTRCLATGETSKKDVLASYGSTAHRFLSIEQNDSGGPCGSFGEAKSLGHRRVESVRAKLYGACGFGGDPSCSSRDISLYLSWTRHGMAYLAASHDERLKKLVSFARGLRHLG